MKKLILMLAVLVQVTVVFAQHFKITSEGANTAFMNIYLIKAEIDAVALEAGDEIAVFDGNICCGVVILTQPVSETTSAEIIAGANDGGSNGFTDGKNMYFRYWDSSASKEYTNVVATFDGGTGYSSVFLSGGSAVVGTVTGNTTKTWIGVPFPGFESWTNTFNWSDAILPEPNSDVIIPATAASQPIIDENDAAICGSLTFTGTPTLTVKSDVTGTGSLIVANGITGTATVNVQRYMTGNTWHMTSSPLSGPAFSDFLAANSNISNNGTNNGMIKYLESQDDWIYGITGNLSLGEGFGVRIDASGVVTFSGSLLSGDVSTSVTSSAAPGNGWNLVGNPFTSAIYTKQEVNGFLVVNDAVMSDPSYKAMYVWDQNAYTIINSTEGQASLASGQGFFIKAASSGNVNFTKSMQVHETTASFKSGVIPISNIVLSVKAGDLKSSTKINFIEDMTDGLDPSYDAGILRSGRGFDLYTRLVEDNGVDFAVQALPIHSSGSFVIPIGVDAIKGGEVVFSAQSLNLPVSYDMIIEDKLTNSQTNIKNGGLYVTDLAANSNGVGRFYLHVGSSLQTGLDEVVQDDLSVYTIDESLYIKGKVSNNAQFMVYSIDGRLINRIGATSQNLNRMSISGYTPGIYLVKVQDLNKYKPVKFVVGK